MKTIEQLDRDGVTYDRAIPQETWNDIFNKTRENPLGEIVVTYSEREIFGRLTPVTNKGQWLMFFTYGRL